MHFVCNLSAVWDKHGLKIQYPAIAEGWVSPDPIHRPRQCRWTWNLEVCARLPCDGSSILRLMQSVILFYEFVRHQNGSLLRSTSVDRRCISFVAFFVPAPEGIFSHPECKVSKAGRFNLVQAVHSIMATKKNSSCVLENKNVWHPV